MSDAPGPPASLDIVGADPTVDGDDATITLRLRDTAGAEHRVRFTLAAAEAVIARLRGGLVQAYGHRAAAGAVPPPHPTTARDQAAVRTFAVARSRDGAALAIDFATDRPHIDRMVLHPRTAQGLAEALAASLRPPGSRSAAIPAKPPKRRH